jgi:hypothetical protein
MLTNVVYNFMVVFLGAIVAIISTLVWQVGWIMGGLVILIVWFIVIVLQIVGIVISMKNTYSKKTYKELDGGK